MIGEIEMSYDSVEEVRNRVKEHYDKVKSFNLDVVGVFLQGSWNYGLGYEGSDVDTKPLFCPLLKILLERNRHYLILMY